MASYSKTKTSFLKNWRLATVLFLLMFFAGAIIVRLFFLQVASGDFYINLAQNQQQIFEELTPQRGKIFIQDKYQMGSDEDYFVVATNRTYQMLYAVPKEIDSKEERIRAAAQLSQIINQPEEMIENKINKDGDPYEPIANKLTDEQAQKIKDLKLKGIYLSPETWRFYPGDNFLSHVVGFVGFSGDKKVGQCGVERYYQKDLSGEPGLIETAKDAIGRWILAGDYKLEPAQDGDNLVLTIDQNIQFMAEKELKQVMEKWDAELGTAIVMEPRTGKILAMASFPDFNPNEYSTTEDINVFLNPATQKLFEPGSVFKPITMSAGIDAGKITSQTTYTDAGLVQIGGYTITNAAEKSYGLCTMTKVLEKSINTGAVFAQKQLGPDLFREYIEKFGFGEPTGIDLDGEIAGNITNLKSGGPEINFATASFGQGVAMTPIELIDALGAIANGGKLMRPYLVEKILHSDGTETAIAPQVRRQAISERTASEVTSMLVSTVRNGYDKIKLKGYLVAGKTGTAQIPSPDKRGYSDEFIHTFVGWAPAFEPKFIILLKMDKPKGIRFASDSLAPAFANLTQFLLNYYGIPPEE